MHVYIILNLLLNSQVESLKEKCLWSLEGRSIFDGYQMVSSLSRNWHRVTFPQDHKPIEYHMSLAHRIYLQFEHTGNMVPAQRKARPELRALDELLMIGIIIKKTRPSISRKSVSIFFPL